ncbi:MAG: hypothetical protein ACJAS9_002398 [Polaribacter sp.]
MIKDRSKGNTLMKVALVSIPVQDPVKAYEIYTSKLGFMSKEFDPEASLTIVVSADDKDGTAILLEPCLGSFAENYQKSAFDANLPIMALGGKHVKSELERMKVVGIKLRPELDQPKWGIEIFFEDGCGNLLMIEETSAQ